MRGARGARRLVAIARQDCRSTITRTRALQLAFLLLIFAATPFKHLVPGKTRKLADVSVDPRGN